MYSLMIVLMVTVATAVTSFGAGWGVRTWKAGYDDKVELQAMEAARDVAIAQRDAEQKASDAIADRFETKLANLRITNRTITNEVRHELEKTVYGTCTVPESGGVLLNRNVDAANRAAGYEATDVQGAVPAAATVAKPNDGRPLRP